MESPEEELPDGASRFFRHAWAACRTAVVRGLRRPAGVDPDPRGRPGAGASGCCCTPARPGSVIPTASTVVVPSSRALSRPSATPSTGKTAPTTAARANNCDNANKNPRIFTDTNLARYDAVVLLNSSQARPAALGRRAARRDHQVRPERRRHRRRPQRDRHGHHRHDVGLVGRQQRATRSSARRWRVTRRPSLTNIAQVQVEDNNHLATKDLPDTYGFGDEHYNFNRNVRGDHHVLANLDERTYTPGGNAMGQDHPITWCKLYDGDNINDGTGVAKNYSDGRTWVTVDGPLRRLLHGERRQQQPDQADRRRRPLGRGRGQEVRLLGHRLVLLHAHGDRPRREQPDRHRRRQGRQGLLVGDR